MRPRFELLTEQLKKQIVSEACQVLAEIGMEINNPNVLSLLSEHGARIDKETKRAYFSNELVNKALRSAPSSVKLYDVLGQQTHDLSGYNVHFTPGSAALNILDHKTNHIRKPSTEDYVQYAKLVSQLKHIAAQSTAFIPSDVHENISDSYRLFLSLLYCEKPVVTGTFTVDSFNVMKDFQVAVRGSARALREKPLTIFSCCPTSPLKWGDVTSQNLLDCAKYGIPVEYISMPLSGFMAPVTLVGTVIQHTAETLSGVVISQLASPGTPVIYGGSPAIFDVRYETTPMGAIETMMVDCAYNEIGKHLGLPTQAYISLSDSKHLDAQAGMESAIGATLAALSGINSISGPGMLDFESCQSLEKLVLDNEICGMMFRLIQGIEPREDFPSVGLFKELLNDGHLLISNHSRRYLKTEHFFPSSVICRSNNARFIEEGSLTLGQRAHAEVESLLSKYQPSRLPAEVQKELCRLMETEARRYGQNQLPNRG
ncbi:MAG: trimethylamine methyltransferase family protein [Deltaproteobacteria bacterium]|nr:trimethylamine methyltransferase family protein [Deltaproteobacteria bacterium]